MRAKFINASSPKKCTINIFIQIKIILFELLFTSVPADCCSADPELKCLRFVMCVFRGRGDRVSGPPWKITKI